MKYGTVNRLRNATIATTNITSQVSTPSNMVNRNTLQSYIASQFGAGLEISFSLSMAYTFDLVTIANITGPSGNVTITLKLATVTQATAVKSITSQVMQTYVVAPFNSVSADEVVIAFETPAAAGQFEIGYVYGGPLSAAINPEAFRISIISADPFQTSRAGTPETSLTYLIERVEVTLPKIDFSDMRAFAVAVMEQGYGNPLVWYFDEDCILSGEAILAVWDSETFSIDAFFRAGDEALANATIALLEVY
jgi:hypothetical protein